MASRQEQRAASGEVLALGFGTSVAMWFIGYLGRMPIAPAPSAALALGLLLCLAAGGFVAGRMTGRWRTGAAAGLLSSVVNLLILGSLLRGGPGALSPSAIWWLPGSLALGAALGAAGAAAGAATRTVAPAPVNWTGALSSVAAAATLLQLLVGGFVTGNRAGLAVVDWPNSFGTNMFLYPLARMTGGIYYEHAHRLFGSLVGLTTLVLAVHLVRVERRMWVKRLGLAAVAGVIFQGVLGGLRVTGGFTLSTSPEAMAPSTTLAIVHGVVGPAFFGLMTVLAASVSTSWASGAPPLRSAHAPSERVLSALLVGATLVQIVLGAILRQLGRGLFVHITFAVAVLGLALLHGSRLWGLYPASAPLRRIGRLVMTVAAIQVALGVVAFFAVEQRVDAAPRAAWDVLVTTVHQAGGSLLLGCAALAAAWSRRLLAPGGAGPGGA